MAVGAPGEDVGGAADAGMVTVFGYDGRQATEVLVVHQGTPGVPGASEKGAGLGDAPWAKARFGAAPAFGSSAGADPAG